MFWSQVTYRLSVSPKSFWKWFPFSRSGQEDLLSCAFAIQRLDQSEHSQEYQSKQRGEIAAVAAPGAAVFLGDFIWSSSVHRPELSLVGVCSWLMGTEIKRGVQSPPQLLGLGAEPINKVKLQFQFSVHQCVPCGCAQNIKLRITSQGYGGSLISEGLERGPKSVTLTLWVETLLGDWMTLS